MRGGGSVQTYYYQRHEGLGVYRSQQEDPENLEDVWPRIEEPGLQHAHQKRIQPVDSASTTATWWFITGLVGLAAGLGTAAAIQKESKTGAAVAGLSGLGIGLGGLIGGWIIMPSPRDEMSADARRRLFFPEEDDLEAVARGVDGSNARHRKACGGEPVPFEPVVTAPRAKPIKASLPAPAPFGKVQDGTTTAPSPTDGAGTRPEPEDNPSAPAPDSTVPSRAFEPTQ
jgi:hypothetical protein